MSSEGRYEVVWPLARSTGKALKMIARLREGKAKRIGFLWDYVFRGDEMFPLLLREEWTDILLAGDPGRNQSKIYFNNQEQGSSISRKVSMPRDWRSRIGK